MVISIIAFKLKKSFNLCDKLMIRRVRQDDIKLKFINLIFCFRETISTNTIFNTKHCLRGTNEDDW